MTKDEYWFWLVNISGVGRKTIRKLLEIYKTPENVFFAQKNELLEMVNIKEKIANEIIRSRENKVFLKAYDNMKKREIKFIHYETESFPENLKNMYDPPFAIYVKGELPSEYKNIAIIGARNCSEYGKIQALEYAKIIAGSGIGIVSGMAEGIDSYGHKGALQAGGKTYAVLGCGINVCYPKENINLYEEICEKGGIISEYPMNASPMAWCFPDRNRIISALSEIVLVIEAKKKSGSLITVDFALEQGKDVFAVPGRVGDKLSEGCNYLLANGAGCAFSPYEILNQFGLNDVNNNKIIKKTVNSLEKDEDMVYSCVDLNPKNLEDIMYESGLDIGTVTCVLLSLEMKGYIQEVSKNYYSKTII